MTSRLTHPGPWHQKDAMEPIAMAGEDVRGQGQAEDMLRPCNRALAFSILGCTLTVETFV